MPSVHWRTVLATALCAAAYSQGLAQVAPSTILTVEVENLVQYVEDTPDLSKFATDPNTIIAVQPKNFYFTVQIGDIVAVNGQPAKGTFARERRRLNLTMAPSPGQAIADTIRAELEAGTLEILNSDGNPIGTIMTYGLASGQGTAPPGAPLAVTNANFTIVGGTGAFLGARGQFGQAVTSQSIAIRQASIMEDPANRRVNRGGRAFWVLHVIPLFRPEIVATSSGPAVLHADFSAVTAAKPAKAGEVLIAQTTGLGPTVPGVDPGQPFPSDVLKAVNSPLSVAVNGKAALVINAIGWPGLVDTYRVDFQVPDGTRAGAAAIQLTAAWIAGSAVNIPTQ